MQQYAVVRTQTPVAVLTTAVDAVEGFFVEQHTETVLAGHLLHQTHQQHVMVNGQVALLKDRSQLKLVGCHLVVTCLHGDGQLQRLYLEVLHEGLHTVGDGTKVVVVHLLVLRTLVAHQRTTRHQQVRTGRVETLVHEEILLFPAQVHLHLGHVVIEILANILSGLVHGVDSTEQGSLVVQGLTRIGDKDGGDTQRVVDNKHGRCGIPGRVAACLEGVTDATVGE